MKTVTVAACRLGGIHLVALLLIRPKPDLIWKAARKTKGEVK